MSHSINGSGDAKLEIHSLTDGKLIKYGIRTRFSNDNKKQLINCLISVIRDRANLEVKDFGIRGLEIIRESIGAPPNYQSFDALLADDIVCEICDLITDIADEEIINTVINHISEQLKDMITTNGTCPSGRCNRLMNVYTFLRDYTDGVHLSPEQKLITKQIH